MVHFALLHFCTKNNVEKHYRIFKVLVCSIEEKAVSYNTIVKWDFETLGSINNTNHTTHISLWKMDKQTFTPIEMTTTKAKVLLGKIH